MWDAIIIAPFINIMLGIYNLVGNFGVAIILFTLLSRVLLYPLTAQQIRGAAAMQELQKDKRYIEMQEKYKGDKEKLAQEQMALYKEMKINPFASCLPTLIQFPIIIGLYQALIQTMANTPLDLFKLTQHVYPWLLDVSKIIPLESRFLWMDLSQPERVYIFGFGLPVLAIIVMITTYIQSKLITPPAANPKDQSAMMSGMMNIYMPFFMGWLALTLASGLALYFVASNVFGIAQYALIGKVYWANLIPKFTRPAAIVPAATEKTQKSKSKTK